jgi:hypothetical protein
MVRFGVRLVIGTGVIVGGEGTSVRPLQPQR